MERKHRLIAAYRANGGNMSAAMRAAGIASRRTAYLWWHRFLAEGENGLRPRSHASKRRGRTSEGVSALVCMLRERHPYWGRRRLAQGANEQLGRAAISPSGVEGILRRRQLWAATGRYGSIVEAAPRAVAGSEPDRDVILHHIELGLAASVADDARAAAHELIAGMYNPLRADVSLALRWLRGRESGRQLLRGHLQLGHSLMNIGRWQDAEAILSFTASLLSEPPHGGQTPDRNERLLGYSLWYDDLWIECLQYLGIVTRVRDGSRAQGYLHTALDALTRPGAVHREPSRPDALRSNVERDLAVVLRHELERGRRVTLGEVARHLACSEACLHDAQPAGMRAAWLVERARLRALATKGERGARRIGWWSACAAIERDVEAALALVVQHGSPLLAANVFIDAAALYDALGIPTASAPIATAARNCLAFGYAHQAAQLVALPQSGRLLGDDVLVPLRQLAATAVL